MRFLSFLYRLRVSARVILFKAFFGWPFTAKYLHALKKAWSPSAPHAPKGLRNARHQSKITTEVHAEYALIVYDELYTQIHTHGHSLVVERPGDKKLRSFWEAQTTSINVLICHFLHPFVIERHFPQRGLSAKLLQLNDICKLKFAFL